MPRKANINQLKVSRWGILHYISVQPVDPSHISLCRIAFLLFAILYLPSASHLHLGSAGSQDPSFHTVLYTISVLTEEWSSQPRHAGFQEDGEPLITQLCIREIFWLTLIFTLDVARIVPKVTFHHSPWPWTLWDNILFTVPNLCVGAT